MQVVFYVIVFIIGACLGSFLCCQARRLRLKETKKPSLGRRSVCLHCKTKLKWYENLPIISWLIQKGKCRHCHKKIGVAEILAELATGITAVAIFASSGHWQTFVFALTILLSLALIFLAIYDGLYGELPTFVLIIAGVIATALVITKLITVNFTLQPILDIVAAVAVLGGLYLILYLVSRGKWVGDGDWILGSIIAAALGTPWLALIALFVANFSACLITLPTLKSRKSHKIYFGPFLVFAYIFTLVLTNYGIINLW